MKSFLGFVCLFIISGCSMASLPTTLELENSEGIVVGHAFAVGDNQFMTADHIFAVHGDLFVQNNPITVLTRDSAKDVLHFSLPLGLIEDLQPALLKSGLVLDDDYVHWGDRSGWIFRSDETLRIGDVSYTDLITVTGAVVPGESGLPLYDHKNRVIGMVIGGEKRKVFVTRLK